MVRVIHASDVGGYDYVTSDLDGWETSQATEAACAVAIKGKRPKKKRRNQDESDFIPPPPRKFLIGKSLIKRRKS